jgi:hypothetical protein
MIAQRFKTAELELALHVHVDTSELLQKARQHAIQPLMAGMALHADAQHAVFATRILADLQLCGFDVGQHAPRQFQYRLA